MRTRVLVADDHQIVREGLCSLLGGIPDVEVVADVADGREAVQATLRLKPDVALLDVSMPGLNGPDAALQIKAALARVRIIAVSMHGDERFVQRMFEAGASAYLLKECAFQDLRQAVRAVTRGERYLCTTLAHRLARVYVSRLCASQPPKSLLSAREREVLQLLSEGRCTKEVADRLHVSVKTVETHRRNLMDKVGCRTVVDLTRYAIREGITFLDTQP